MTTNLDNLTNNQQELVQTFLNVTGTFDIERAINILEANSFDIEKAIHANFDDSETSSNVGNNQETPRETENRQTNAIERNAGGTFNLISLFTWPFSLAFHLIVNIFSLSKYLMGSYKQIDNGGRNSVHNYIDKFEEAYGRIHPDFLEISYSQALERVKQEYKFLLVILNSDEHDDTDSFCRNTLTDTGLINFVKENNVMVYINSVNNSEGYQVSHTLQANTYPFMAIVSMRKRTGDGSSFKPSVVDRIEGIASSDVIIRRLANQMERLNPQLAALRMQHEEQNAARRIREQQDMAYQMSLKADQDKARKQKEQQALKAHEDKLKQEALRQSALNAKYQELYLVKVTAQLPEEPTKEEPNTSTFSFRLPNGERVVRRFYAESTIEDVYNFISTRVQAKESEMDAESIEITKDIVALPKDYHHNFKFVLKSPLPKATFPCTKSILKDTKGMWPGGSLMVEFDEE